MFGSTKRPGMRGTNSINMGAYYGYGSDQLIVASNAVPAATAPAETSPLYKFGMSPTLWGLAALAGIFAYRHFRKRK